MSANRTVAVRRSPEDPAEVRSVPDRSSLASLIPEPQIRRKIGRDSPNRQLNQLALERIRPPQPSINPDSGIAELEARRVVARMVRTTPTDAEIRLWSRLRRKQLEGFRFRRQHPMGPYVVDFFCPEAKLIVEVDGGQHAESAGDVRRTRWLEAHGYRVIRFWNNDVLGNTEGVLLSILEALRA